MATDTPTLQERYRAAIHTSNLGSDPRSARSPSDVVGAYGLADKHLTTGYVKTGKGPQDGYKIRESPLSVALERLLGGDNNAAHDIVRQMAEMVWSRADHERTKPKLTRPAAHDMACGCLAWYRNGTCRTCGGHGKTLIAGTKTHSERDCPACYDALLAHSSGKVPFEINFMPEHRELARWLVVEMERALGRAGPAAMNAIAERMSI
jgi:hypothetical protein